MSKEALQKYASKSQDNKKKCFALGGWCNRQGNIFSLQEVFDCLYDAAEGNEEKLTKLIEQLTSKSKVFGRSSVVFGDTGPQMSLTRGEDGVLHIVGYNPNFTPPERGQHQARGKEVLRQDGQVKQNVINTREKLYDLGVEVRKLYQGQSNEFITFAMSAIKLFAKKHKISEMSVVDRLKKDVYTLDTSEGIYKAKIVPKMKTVKLNESQLREILEATKLTEYKFYNNVQRFLSDLLKDPVGAKVPFLLQANNIARNQLLYHLKSQGIINRHQKISDKDSQGNPKTAKMIIRYSVPKKDFAKKMKKLFIALVAKNVPEKIEKMLNECEGGAPMGATAGPFVTSLSGVQRRKMPVEIDETTTASNVTSNGDISVVAPFCGDKETLDRTPGFSVERQDESVDNGFNDDEFVSAAVYIYGVNQDGEKCVLASKRRGTKEFDGGLFNVCVGMREPFDETIFYTAIREVKEETGISISKNQLKFVGGEKWGQNKVGANFVVNVGKNIQDYSIGKGDGENDKFQWMPLNNVGSKKWAFGMDKTVMKMSQNNLDEYLDRDMSNVKKKFKDRDYDDNGFSWSEEAEDGKELIKNEWMVHFSNDAPKIAQDGFKKGNAYDKKLKSATYRREKDDGGFNYAYLAEDVLNNHYGRFMNYLQDRLTPFVMFKGNGYRFYHGQDGENQVVFNNMQTETIVYVLYAYNQWCVSKSLDPDWKTKDQNPKPEDERFAFNNTRNILKGILYSDDDIKKVIRWVMNNFEQYRNNFNY